MLQRCETCTGPHISSGRYLTTHCLVQQTLDTSILFVKTSRG